MTPAQTKREVYAHVLQLCDYVEDMRVEPKMLTNTDYGVMRKKAAMVRSIILKGDK